MNRKIRGRLSLLWMMSAVRRLTSPFPTKKYWEATERQYFFFKKKDYLPECLCKTISELDRIPFVSKKLILCLFSICNHIVEDRQSQNPKPNFPLNKVIEKSNEPYFSHDTYFEAFCKRKRKKYTLVRYNKYNSATRT